MPTYREGPLAASAVQSLLPHVDTVLVYDGPVGEPHTDGEVTDRRAIAKNARAVIKYGQWKTEADKRNEMLSYTRRLPKPTWGVYLDADETFIGAQYIRDYIWAATVNRPDETVAALPVLITEVDGSVGRAHRIIRLDLLGRHVLSMSQLLFYGSPIVATFPVIPVWRPGEPIAADESGYRGPVLPGTPSIHHRSYYRPQGRGEHRLHRQEITDFDALVKASGLTPEVAGATPVQQDPGFIVAREVEK